ncbi:MAG: hypoxanthine phosphoribosyltransferase [Bacteroidales bacterium]|nr:hypoxanthine phosphoribosyltransferase [Bacteroidales bacterium]
MDKVVLHDKTFVPFIDNSVLEDAIDKLSVKINADYRGRKDIPLLLCVLNGAIMFTGELLKRLDFPLEVCAIKLASYQGTGSTGKIQETMGLTSDVRGRSVIVCEDIVDTGNTMEMLKQKLLDQGAADVRICTMLLKPEVFKNKMPLDYVGMEIPARFIVGFGLDYDGLGRNIKDIYVLSE